MPAIDPNFKMTVRTRTVSGASNFCNLLTFCNFISAGHEKSGIVAVICLQTVSVANNDQISISALPAGIRNRTAVSGIYRASVCKSKVYTGVESTSAISIV